MFVVITDAPVTIASLFSGCGGLDLGFIGGFEYLGKHFSALNSKIVYANDFDKDAALCFNENLPFYDPNAYCDCVDIRDVSSDSIPDFNILLAGFPCQPFSNAGSRGGVNDKHNRGTLFEECERIIKDKIHNGHKPLAFVFENVRGILSSKMNDGTPVVSEISKRMKKLGYLVSYKLLKTSDYGVPQNRYRVIIVGVDSDLYPEFSFDTLLDIVNKEKIPSLALNTPEKLLLGYILQDIPTSHEASLSWPYTDSTQKMIEQIGPCKHGVEAFEYFKRDYKISDLPPVVFEGRSWKDIPYELLKPRFKKIHDNPKRYHSPKFFRRFAFGEINGTITASAQPENCGITHPIENRRYSVGEIQRIQSFPDSFNFSSISLPSRYKVIGNAVPPVFAWVLASALLDALKTGEKHE